MQILEFMEWCDDDGDYFAFALKTRRGVVKGRARIVHAIEKGGGSVYRCQGESVPDKRKIQFDLAAKSDGKWAVQNIRGA